MSLDLINCESSVIIFLDDTQLLFFTFLKQMFLSDLSDLTLLCRDNKESSVQYQFIKAKYSVTVLMTMTAMRNIMMAATFPKR